MNSQQKILSVVLFTSFYILPHYLNFKKNDISFSGDKNFLESEKINNFKDLFAFSQEYLIVSFNLLENAIFIFFISALLFKYLIGHVK